MKLNEKQAQFSECLGQLLNYAFLTDQRVIVAEVYRPPEMARLNAERGIGIVNSVHTKKLAADLFRYVDGTVSWDIADYRDLGRFWKLLHPMARWGGDFKSRVDAVHFSFQHGKYK